MTAPDLPAEKREALAEALSDHEYVYPNSFCCCGHGMAEPWREFFPHLADALAPLVARWLAEAKAEALREAAEARSEWQALMYAEDERHFATGSMHGAGVDVCADVVEVWLQDRAERIARGDA